MQESMTDLISLSFNPTGPWYIPLPYSRKGPGLSATRSHGSLDTHRLFLCRQWQSNNALPFGKKHGIGFSAKRKRGLPLKNSRQENRRLFLISWSLHTSLGIIRLKRCPFQLDHFTKIIFFKRFFPVAVKKKA